MPNSKHVLAIDNGASVDEGSLSGTRNSISTWKMGKTFGNGYTQYNNIYKLYNVVGPVQHSHRLCRSGARPALTKHHCYGVHSTSTTKSNQCAHGNF
ncbi:hypothetical protein E5676_scaffold428G00230 [Cucumis melo var. makuwa]|uniref:Uncharacterized protein n=1 Tax=Cucumis melo var. makuwa TaxID=1194695 RepID=A0A5D3DK40_CUCMM|nr:hypothetical protein E6C27_scaffold708G00240 [Cucumis melo var. makuwa]TYK23944.1 hypothetical protein E5676_scaffold428G00230 [Cucumis melo var. makuwa]